MILETCYRCNNILREYQIQGSSILITCKEDCLLLYFNTGRKGYGQKGKLECIQIYYSKYIIEYDFIFGLIEFMHNDTAKKRYEIECGYIKGDRLLFHNDDQIDNYLSSLIFQ